MQSQKIFIFKFDGLYGNAFLIIVLPMLLFFIGVREFLRGHYLGDLVLAVAICFFLTLGYFQVMVKADIAIDDEWISRYAFGKLIQRVRWDSIDEIRLFDKFGGSGYGYNIYPARNKNYRFGLNRKLAFSDEMQNPDGFIHIMNKYVARYNVRIESCIRGKKTYPSQLPEIGKSTVTR